jgi:predicted ATPase
MYISKFHIDNYKSYRESGEIAFKPGFNILTGQNSAGKTALLEALTLQFTPKPHISNETVPSRTAKPKPVTSASITFSISGVELVSLLRTLNFPQYFFTRPEIDSVLPTGSKIDGSPNSMNIVLHELVEQIDLNLSLRLDRTAGRGEETWIPEHPSIFGFYQGSPQNPNNREIEYYRVLLDPDRTLLANGHAAWSHTNSDVRILLAEQLRARIYRFWAERFIVGESAFGYSPTLAPNAENLPEVLNVLDGNTARFQRLNALVQEVLPQIKHISVRPLPGNKVQILVWPVDYSTEKDYLAIPLNECGSGVAQVLAILYVVVISEDPHTIIVDEPQSFLHPGAVRKLIEVLKRFPQHQYIFATHSPTVISTSEPATVTIVRSTEDGTKLQPIDPMDSKALQVYLDEIGARLSDVFGADNILWVEGETEEECFPKIWKGIAKKSLMGTAIVGIRQTGDFSARDKRKVLDLYRRLSQANTLLPPAIGFLFDQECLSQTDKDDLLRMGRGVVHFLARRMYENYLLNPTAIASVANSIEGFRATPVSVNQVDQLLGVKQQELRYFCEGAKEPANWKINIDGAKVLADIFKEMSENRVVYNKTRESVALTDWLIQNDPEALTEVATTLGALLETK